PMVVEALVTQRTAAASSELERLTPRARDVLEQMPQGRNNAGIAQALFLSERAIEKHINSLFSKLGLSGEPDVHRRVKAVLLFLAESGPGTPPHWSGGCHPWPGRRRSETMDPMDVTRDSTRTVRVLIVDDQLPFRAVARTVIGM